MSNAYAAEDSDVLAAVTGLAAIRDPLERYHRASADLGLHQAVIGQLATIRAAAVAELHRAGASYAAIAGTTGLTRARVQQLVEAGR
jgi:hypothetical protein